MSSGGAPPPLRWRPTNAPLASSRTDDIWFLDPTVGWAVNSNGQILRTDDGGDSWAVQRLLRGVYLRCIGFANPEVGWVGTLSPGRKLFHTTDGGATWGPVTGLPADAPARVCGLSVVDEQVMYGSGTNFPTDIPRMLKTTDGGRSWSAWDMRPHASILIDTHFEDPLRGWVVGGKAEVSNPNPTRDDVKAVVLRTEDGGATWVDRTAAIKASLPLGEWGWKIQFLDDRVGFVSLESFTAGAILKTMDGGATWKRLPINDQQGNVDLEGVGFVDETHGWVGGWGTADFTGGFSSETHDGGETWRDANEIGKFINRFRFFGNPVTVGYASGLTVYKYTSEPASPTRHAVAAPPLLLDAQGPHTATRPLTVEFKMPEGAVHATFDLWERFGAHVACLLDEASPTPGRRSVVWDGRDESGHARIPGSYIYRLTVDDHAESRIVRVT
jgi:hypothetical protein